MMYEQNALSAASKMQLVILNYHYVYTEVGLIDLYNFTKRYMFVFSCFMRLPALVYHPLVRDDCFSIGRKSDGLYHNTMLHSINHPLKLCGIQ